MATFCSDYDEPIGGNGSCYDEDKAALIAMCSKKVSRNPLDLL
jgi:hypothetical protein